MTELQLLVGQAVVLGPEHEADGVSRADGKKLCSRLARRERAAAVGTGPTRRSHDPAAIGDRFAERIVSAARARARRRHGPPWRRPRPVDSAAARPAGDPRGPCSSSRARPSRRCRSSSSGRGRCGCARGPWIAGYGRRPRAEVKSPDHELTRSAGSLSFRRWPRPGFASITFRSPYARSIRRSRSSSSIFPPGKTAREKTATAIRRSFAGPTSRSATSRSSSSKAPEREASSNASSPSAARDFTIYRSRSIAWRRTSLGSRATAIRIVDRFVEADGHETAFIHPAFGLRRARAVLGRARSRRARCPELGRHGHPARGALEDGSPLAWRRAHRSCGALLRAALCRGRRGRAALGLRPQLSSDDPAPRRLSAGIDGARVGGRAFSRASSSAAVRACTICRSTSKISTPRWRRSSAPACGSSIASNSRRTARPRSSTRDRSSECSSSSGKCRSHEWSRPPASLAGATG